MTPIELTFEQREAAHTSARNALVIAGAGSGKTRVILARIMHQIEAGHSPASIAAVTFTNAGVNEMRERLEARGIRIGFIGTLHSLMLRIRQSEGKHLPFMSVLAAEDADALLEETARKLGVRTASIEKLTELRRQWWRVQPELSPRTATPETRVLQAYYRTLFDSRMIDYDGLLWQGLEILRAQHSRVTPPPFTHFHVDEYQDSAAVDAEIYATLESMGASFFCVGDPDQSIFSFRGGCLDNILAMSRRPDVTTYFLADNYRCKAGIVGVANRLISRNAKRVVKEMRATTGETGSSRCTLSASVLEHNAVVREEVIASLMTGGSVAVLVRTNSVAVELAGFLRDADIPVELVNKSELPKDWLRLKMALTLMSDVTNECTRGRFLARYPDMNAIPPTNTHSATDAVDNLHRFGVTKAAIAIVAEWSRENPGATLRELVLAMAQEEREFFGNANEGERRAYVGTIHGAKGREWDTVVLAAFEQGAIPRRQAEPDELEEERRLAYVGVTRARQRLVVVASKTRTFVKGNFKREEERGFSRFVDEMRPDTQA